MQEERARRHRRRIVVTRDLAIVTFASMQIVGDEATGSLFRSF